MNLKWEYCATAPSNIAFLKYWGKSAEDTQWPANDSLSMTLANCVTETSAMRADLRDHQFYFGNTLYQRSDQRWAKVYQHLDRLSAAFGMRERLIIRSRNSFPDSCGIASSASGFMALTLAALACWNDLESFEAFESHGISRNDLAQCARMGSGSAFRSIFGGYVQWDRGPSPDQQVVQMVEGQWILHDVIVLISEEAKPMSSSEAHRLAWTSPLFPVRLAGSMQRLEHMKDALVQKDMSRLGPLLEIEALEMHAVMMSSTPAVRYFGNATATFLVEVRRMRMELGIPVYFTIDAGPNVHLICEPAMLARIEAELTKSKRRYIVDQVGSGPSLIRRNPDV